MPAVCCADKGLQDITVNERVNHPDETAIESEEQPYIRLDHFLQACGVETGGQAKQLIQNGNVLVNGQVETRRRKKLREGDEVELAGDVFVVTAASGKN